MQSVDFNTKFSCDTPYTCTQNTSGSTIPELENEIIKSLDAYYKCILTKGKVEVKNGSQFSGYGYNYDSTNCSGTVLADISNNIAKLNSALQKLPQPSSGESNAEITDTSPDKLKELHAQILKTRNELDIKMKEINRSEDSVYSMYKAKYDSTMYSSITWTILATSLIYYIFVKL